MNDLPTLPVLDAGLVAPDRRFARAPEREALRVRMKRWPGAFVRTLWQVAMGLVWLLECLWSVCAALATTGGVAGGVLALALLAVLVWGGIIWGVWQAVAWLLG